MYGYISDAGLGSDPVYLALSGPSKKYFISPYNGDLIFLCIHVKYMKAFVGFDRQD